MDATKQYLATTHAAPFPGNAKALAVLKASSKEKDLKAKVSGTLDGETVQVESVTLE